MSPHTACATSRSIRNSAPSVARSSRRCSRHNATATGSLRADGAWRSPASCWSRATSSCACEPHGTSAEPFDAWRGMVVLDTKIYPHLQSEGWARDLVRLVQNGRKEAGLAVTDRIALRVAVADPIAAAVRRHAAYVSGETLAASFDVVSKATGPRLVEDEIDGHRIVLEIEHLGRVGRQVVAELAANRRRGKACRPPRRHGRSPPKRTIPVGKVALCCRGRFGSNCDLGPRRSSSAFG